MNAEEQAAAQARDERYQEVSLRAVELLAKAQRAADEAVAEAQSYARDLENSAREQYKQILQRAQSAAQQLATAEGAAGGQGQAAEGTSGAVDAQQLAYVRTYARVAHAQLKSVLAALTEELDQLAAMAEGSVQNHPTVLPPPPSPRSAEPPHLAGHPVGAVPQAPLRPDTERPHPAGPPASVHNGNQNHAATTTGSGTGSWPPIAAPTSSISYFYGGSTWEGPGL